MTLHACYDLSCNPPTYDVTTFLANLEIERVRRGEPDVNLFILPGPAGGFRRDSLWPRGVEQRWRLFHHVMIPICTKLLPSVVEVEYRSRPLLPSDTVGVGERWISLEYIMRALRGGSRPLRTPEPVERDPELVTFTLREAEHHPERNSRTSEWVEAARRLAKLGYRVVIVRDTHRSQEPLAGCAYPAASEDVLVRADLYSRAALNVGISNGPMWMAVFMDVPVLMLRPTTNAAHGGYDDRYYARCGLPRGSQLPTCDPYRQRLEWAEDHADNIVEAVELMMRGGQEIVVNPSTGEARTVETDE